MKIQNQEAVLLFAAITGFAVWFAAAATAATFLLSWIWQNIGTASGGE